MKTTFVMIFSSLLVLFTANIGMAASKQAKKTKLSTEVDFDDRLVGGKYQYSSESITTVENEKVLDDLIGVRKNFSDRVKRSKELL